MSAAAAMTGHLALRVARNGRRALTGTDAGSAPVRRNSRDVDATAFCRFTPNGEKRLALRKLKAWAMENRERGRCDATASAVHVLEMMMFGGLQDRFTGVIDHAYTFIAARCRRAYQTVVDAVHQLEALGILVVQRRCRRGDGDGPKWVQDTNLYRFESPGWLNEWWDERHARIAMARAGRAPEDFVHASEEAEASNSDQEREWSSWQAQQAKDDALKADQARDVRGPGAAAWRAEVAARGLRVLPDST